MNTDFSERFKLGVQHGFVLFIFSSLRGIGTHVQLNDTHGDLFRKAFNSVKSQCITSKFTVYESYCLKISIIKQLDRAGTFVLHSSAIVFKHCFSTAASPGKGLLTHHMCGFKNVLCQVQ